MTPSERKQVQEFSSHPAYQWASQNTSWDLESRTGFACYTNRYRLSDGSFDIPIEWLAQDWQSNYLNAEW